MVSDFLTWFTAYKAQALIQNERRLILLEGTEDWAFSLLNSISVSDKTWLVYGDSNVIKPNIGLKQYREKLGSESDFITFILPFDSSAETYKSDNLVTKPGLNEEYFNADAFAALSGTLVAGGILFLVMPQWKLQVQRSLFLKRLNHFISKDKIHYVLSETNNVFPVLDLPFVNSTNKVIERASSNQNLEIKTGITTGTSTKKNNEISNKLSEQAINLSYHCKSDDQIKTVQAILKVVSGHRKKPLVITADRGRGKSSALAIACAQLLLNPSDNPIEILITSANISALSVFFAQLKECVGKGEFIKNRFSYLKASVEFIAVDELVSRHQIRPSAGLVIVDEAASIPVYLLKKILQHNHRMVFSSTVHGYEGAGRGFAIKFKDILDDVCPKWQGIEMNEPMRWRLDDPLEKLVFDSCLLNAKLSELSCNTNTNTNSHNKENNAGHITFRKILKDELAKNELLLREIYAILVTAHYQTKPNDIKMLLDNKDLECFCMFSSHNGRVNVVAVALVMKEGAGEQESQNIEAVVSQVTNNKRRLKNHFLPQSLLVHSGVEQAFDYNYFRVMRIAVHPQVQSKGIGSDLLKHVMEYARLHQIDFIGASFGANANLLSFWLKNNFEITRVGFKRDQSSGEHSAMVMHALTKQAEPLFLQWTWQFYQQFEYLLVDEFKYLSAELVILILKNFPQSTSCALTKLALKDVQDFSNGKRQFSSCVFSLHLWLKNKLVSGDVSELFNLPVSQLTAEIGLLLQRIMQKHSVAELCTHYSFTGRKSFDVALKKQVIKILEL